MQGFPFWKKKQKPTKRRTKRFWIREYLKKTGEIWSVPHTVFRVKPIRQRVLLSIYQDESKTLWTFAPYIQKKACRSRDPISPAERLVVTLRYLASRRFQIPVFQLPYREDHHFRVSRDAMFIFDRGTGAQQFKGLVNRRPRRYKFEFSFVGNSRLPTQKSGTRRENRNAPDSPELSPSIPNDWGYLRFRVFICWQNLGQSGKSQMIGDFTVSRLSQILPTNENSKS